MADRKDDEESAQLLGDLRQAVERNELEVYFQPVVAAGHTIMVGAEALLRWHHPVLGLLLPDRFIHLAEKAGLVTPIGEWVFAQTCREIKPWSETMEASTPIRVSVNLSAHQLAQPCLTRRFRYILGSAGLNSERVEVEIEITESAVARNVDAAAAVLGQLRAMGVYIAIDDFGTGYSSLSSLNTFPVDTLKIDRAFVPGIVADATKYQIVKTIVDLGHTLHLRVVAEGVETPGQAALLRTAGVDYLQGFLYGRPMPMAELTRLHGSPSH